MCILGVFRQRSHYHSNHKSLWENNLGVIAQLVERLNGIEEVWGSNPHGSTSLSSGRCCRHFFRFLQRHADDLVHVVVAIGGQAPDEGDRGIRGGPGRTEIAKVRGERVGLGPRFVFLVEGRGIGGGNRVVGFLAGTEVVRIFADNGRIGALLASGMFDFDNASELLVVGIIHLHRGLEEARRSRLLSGEMGAGAGRRRPQAIEG